MAGWLIGGLTFLYLVIGLWRASFPEPPSRITLDVTFPQGLAGRCEPIITTGLPGDSDFLAVRYLDAQNAVVLYDVWGLGGPTSASFALRPGQRRRIEIEMPTLVHVPRFRSHEKRPLRIVLDGEVLLDEPVYFHRRKPAEIFFGVNPLGGTVAGERFRGKLALPDGRNLHGGPESLFGLGARLAWMAWTQIPALLGRIAASAALGFASAWVIAWCAKRRLWRVASRSPTVFPARHVPPHGWFLATAATCMLAFVAMITNGTFRLIFPETFGHFYDYQAQSLLQGRLDLPEPAHSSESFVFEGRHYIYFGPTPALLRLPFTFFEIAFGQLSRCYMTGYYVGLLAAVYALSIHVSRIAGGPKNWPSPFSVVLFVATTGLGTTLFFLSSRAYIYHEAILCGATFALWSSYFSLRYLTEPHRGWWAGAVACGIAAVHARPTTGLFALTMIGCAALAVCVREFRLRAQSSDQPRSSAAIIGKSLLVAVSAIIGVLSFNGLSYLKFRSFEGAPLKYHVQYQNGRLATIEGKNFHLSNLRFNVDTYLWRPDFALRPGFPYYYISARNVWNYPTAKIDLAEPTLAMPYTMPAVFFLAIAGGVFAFAAWPEARVSLGVIAGAAAPMSLALFTAVAVSHRYTADFCPPLILAGAFGLQGLELLSERQQRLVRFALGLLGVASILATLAITLHYQGGFVWGVPDEVKARYESLRKMMDALLGLRP